MTSALSSLKKGRRAPLPTDRVERSIPCRPSPVHEQERSHVGESDGTVEIVDGNSLLSSMTKRLLAAEQQVTSYAQQVIEKDKIIRELQEKVTTLERQAALRWANPNQQSERLKAIEDEFQRCQKQLHEMERFLNDHGLVWVGEPDSDEDVSDGEKHIDNTGLWKTLPGQWYPGASIVQHADHSSDSSLVDINFDRLLESVKELSILGGEGQVHVQHTVRGAKLEHVKAVPLTFYKNGFFLFNGPFRAYTEPSSQQFLCDLLDGYFPSELQSRYPDGVPFEVTDLRDVIYDDPRHAHHFPGAGHELGGETAPSRLVAARSLHGSASSTKKEPCGRHTNVPPGGFVHEDRFLSQLPKSVVRNGRVIDIRDDISTLLRGSDGLSRGSVSLVTTPVVEHMRRRMDEDEGSRPTTPRHISTIRVKMEDGQKTLIIKLPFSATIADLHHYIDQQRPTASQMGYLLRSSFPSRAHTDLSASLHESGLTPNAVVFLVPK